MPRTAASVRTSAPVGRGDRREQPARRRPTSPAKTGPLRPDAACAAVAPRQQVGAQRQDCGTGRGQRQRVGVAGVDAAEQRVDQPVDHLVAEARSDERRRPRRPLVGTGSRTRDRRLLDDAGRHRARRRRPGCPSPSAAAVAGRRASRSTPAMVAGCDDRVAEAELGDQVDAPRAAGPASPRRRRRA